MTPRGIRAPTREKRVGSLRNSTISRTSSLASSTPATSSKVTPVRSFETKRRRERGQRTARRRRHPGLRIWRKMKNQKIPMMSSQGIRFQNRLIRNVFSGL